MRRAKGEVKKRGVVGRKQEPQKILWRTNPPPPSFPPSPQQPNLNVDGVDKPLGDGPGLVVIVLEQGADRTLLVVVAEELAERVLRAGRVALHRRRDAAGGDNARQRQARPELLLALVVVEGLLPVQAGVVADRVVAKLNAAHKAVVDNRGLTRVDRSREKRRLNEQ